MAALRRRVLARLLGVEPLVAAQALACAFFAILFLQSGLDKVVDRKGNLAYLTEHFAKSPLRRTVPLLLTTVTLAEVGSGLASATAVATRLIGVLPGFQLWSMGACCVTLLLLFLGQRVARDYAGAATLAAYFGVALLGFFIGVLPIY